MRTVRAPSSILTATVIRQGALKRPPLDMPGDGRQIAHDLVAQRRKLAEELASIEPWAA